MAIKGNILLGSMVAYIDSIGMIQSNLNTFLNRIPEIYNNMLYVNRYFEFLNYSNLKESNKSKIVINGIDLKDINIQLLRDKISVIFQDYNKYEFTMRKNIDIKLIHKWEYGLMENNFP